MKLEQAYATAMLFQPHTRLVSARNPEGCTQWGVLNKPLGSAKRTEDGQEGCQGKTKTVTILL